MADVDIKALVARLNRFCRHSLEAGAGFSVSRTHHEVAVEHVVHAMLEAGSDSEFAQILTYFTVDTGELRKRLTQDLDTFRSGNTGRPVFSPTLMEWLKEAWFTGSLRFGHNDIRSGILLVTILENSARLTSGAWIDFLREQLPVADLLKNHATITEGSSEQKSAATGGASGEAAAAAPGGGDGSALSMYATNLTERAREDKIDPIFGRDREIRQMVDVLSRRRKSNPILVGEPGVGKTALVEGLARRIAAGDVPDSLKDVELFVLDLGLLQAGASMKGEFEKRLKQVIDEVKESAKPIVLFIDEAHTLIGAGGQAGGGDAANLLKPALARGELRTVAATTWAEYAKYFEKDPALSRRFQLVKVDEPDTELATTMLRGLRNRYEDAHGVLLRDDAIAAAAEMASRYIAGRQHPDKGIDLIDTAAARVKISLATRPAVLTDLEQGIAAAERERDAHLRDKADGAKDRDERIAELETKIATDRDELARLDAEYQREKAAADEVAAARKALGEAREGDDGTAVQDAERALEAAREAFEQVRGETPLIHCEVTPEVVGTVVSDWTGIPVGNMVRDEAAALLNFEDEMRARIKGQDHVMSVLGESIRAAKAGLTDPQTPIGVFLLVGPSGVGKTETAIGVADLLFGGERFMTTINMSEFLDQQGTSRLIGAAPGLVGYGEGGQLTEPVRQRPYSVVLLDEVEKADTNLLNLFYQVFDKGTLTDAERREIDFKNTVIFLTSNLATEEITRAGMLDERPSVEDLIAHIRPILSAHFKPALLARMNIVPYFPLNQDVLQDITRLKLDKLRRRLAQAHRIETRFDDAVVEAIASRCTEVETGARNVDHIVRGTLLPSLSREILGRMADGLPPALEIGLGEDGRFSFEFGDAASAAAPGA